MQMVSVNGKKFRSLSTAAKYIGISCTRLSDLLRFRPEYMYDNFLIKKIEKPKKVKKKRKAYNATKVLQVNTGRVFKTIEEAARVAKADGWTMSKKMSFSGGFIDKEGNEYQRLKPMRTRNTYNAGGMEIKKNYKGRKTMNIIKSLFVKEKPIEIVEKKKIKFEDYPVAVQGLIRKEIRTMIREDKSWSEIKKFLREIGCEQLTIKVDVDE